MGKIYQRIVKEKTEEIIETLVESNFFSDHEITDFSFARMYLNDRLTDKFINGTLNDIEIFDEDEFLKCLNEILVGSVLEQLKNKGFVDSIDNEGDESYFLTTKAKEYISKNKNLF